MDASSEFMRLDMLSPSSLSPVLSLDCDRIINLWGEGSVFSSSKRHSLDDLGDLFMDLGDLEEDVACLFDCGDSKRVSFLGGQPPSMYPPLLPSQQIPTQHQLLYWPGTPCAMPRRVSIISALPAAPVANPERPVATPHLHYIKKENLQPLCVSPFTPSFMCLSNSSDACGGFDTTRSSAESPPGTPSIMPSPNQQGRMPNPSRFACLSTPNQEPLGEAARQRQECLERYREKKARRMYTKMIRYRLRKINADKRPRVKGRFVKKEISLGLAMEAVLDGESTVASESLQNDDCMSDDSS